MPKPVNDVMQPEQARAQVARNLSGLSQAGRGSCDNAIPDESPELHERGVHMSTEAAAVDSAGGPVVKEKTKRKKKLSFPTAFTILFVLTIIAVIATSFVPAGQYAKLQYVADSNVLTVTSPQGEISEVPATQDELDQLGVQIDIEQFTGGSITKAISIPGTYEQLQAQPKGIADVTQAMVSGTIDGVDIMVFILVLGGSDRRGQRNRRVRIRSDGPDEKDQRP